MPDRLLKKFGSPFSHLCRHTHEFLRNVSDKDEEVKQNDSSSVGNAMMSLFFAK